MARLSSRVSSSSKFIFFVVLGVLGAGIPASAQLVPNRTYTQADGLPSDYVTHISQDQLGRMWFATEKGVAMYDGDRFRTLTVRDGLPANFVYQVVHQADGTAWIATAGSDLPVRWDGRRISPFPAEARLTTPVGHMRLDGHGRLLLTNRNSLLVWDGRRLAEVVTQTDMGEILPIDADRFASCGSQGCHLLDTSDPDSIRVRPLLVSGISVDPGDYSIYSALVALPGGETHLVLTTRILSGRLQGDTLHVARVLPFTTMTLQHAVVRQAGGTGWLLGSRHQGLLKWNGETRLPEPVRLHHRSDRVLIASLFQDYEGTVWVSSFGAGVVKIPEWGARLIDRSAGVQDPHIWRFGMDHDRPVAVLKDGVYRLDPASERLLPIWAIDQPRGYLKRGEQTWMGHFPYVTYRDGRTGARRQYPAGDGVNDMEWAPDGSVWIATAGAHQLRATPTGMDTLRMPGLPTLFGVEDIVRAGNTMWLLTNDRGAVRIAADTVTHYQVGDVRSVAESDSMRLIGTTDGLVVIRNGTMERLDTRHGLVGTAVIGIFPASEPGVFWVITRTQIHRFRLGRLERYRSLLPLRPYFATANRLHLDTDGRTLHVASSFGWLLYDLLAESGGTPPPRVSIAGVRVDTTDADPGAGRFTLTSASGTVEFRFLGASFIDEAGVRFRYRLEGADPNWSEIDRGTPVRYAQLAPGTYTMRVKAVNAEGMESAEEARFVVEIRPPYWMTGWFRSGAFILLLIASLLLVRRRITQVREEVQRKGRQRQFEAIQRIGAGIAHDMKNTVFSLSLLAKNLEKRFDQPEFRRDAIETLESSLDYLSRLIERFHHQSDHHEVRCIPADVGQSIRQALDRLQLPEGSDIRVVDRVGSGLVALHDRQALARVVENLAINAIEAMGSGGTLTISAGIGDGVCRIDVEDTGPGMSAEYIRKKLFQPFHTTKTKGFGLGLYTSRELVLAQGGTLEVESKPGKGTRFRIGLPILGT